MSRCQGKRRASWRKILAVLFLTGALAFAALFAAVMYGSYDHISGQPQVMVILGCQVKPWGPSILLQDRLDTALDYLEEHPDMPVVVSGGQGADEPVSEAACMSDYLAEHGVDPDRILMEDRSSNTIENLTNSLALLKAQGYEDELEQVLVVSNGFHLTRARMLWSRVTGEGEHLSTLAAPSSHAPSRLWMYIREPLALVKSYLFDR